LPHGLVVVFSRVLDFRFTFRKDGNGLNGTFVDAAVAKCTTRLLFDSVFFNLQVLHRADLNAFFTQNAIVADFHRFPEFLRHGFAPGSLKNKSRKTGKPFSSVSAYSSVINGINGQSNFTISFEIFSGCFGKRFVEKNIKISQVARHIDVNAVKMVGFFQNVEGESPSVSAKNKLGTDRNEIFTFKVLNMIFQELFHDERQHAVVDGVAQHYGIGFADDSGKIDIFVFDGKDPEIISLFIEIGKFGNDVFCISRS